MRTIALTCLLVALALGQDADPKQAVATITKRLSDLIEDEFGKKFETPVPVDVMTLDELVAYARKNMERFTPPELLRSARRFAVRMRHVPPGFDMVERQLDLLRAGGVGLYDPESKKFYLMESVSDPRTAAFYFTAGHELVHAYRDVDKDYWRRTVDSIRHDTDWATATQFLFEGEAQLVGSAVGQAVAMNASLERTLPAIANRAEIMSAAMRASMNDAKFREFPRMLRATFIAPYSYGLEFAGAIYRHGQSEALSKAYDNSPRSTEQALHPEKYLSETPDEPTVIVGGDPTGALGVGARHLFDNVMGEFEMRMHLAGLLGNRAATEAAAGWDGCRYHVVEHGAGRVGVFGFTRTEKPIVLSMITTWDTRKDAAEFAAAWAAWSAKRDEGVRHDLEPGENKFVVRTKDGIVEIRISGQDVLICDGAPEEAINGVFQALAASRRFERSPTATPKEEIAGIER